MLILNALMFAPFPVSSVDARANLEFDAFVLP